MAPRRQDARALTLSVFVAALMIAQQVAGKSVRDALFLGQFPASALPQAMIAAAIGSVPVVLLTSATMGRFGPGWVAPIALGLNAGLFAAEWALLPRFANAVAACVYVHVAILGSTVISAFWSVINERFDPYTARRAMGRVAAGAAVGGLFGGLLVNQSASRLPLRWFLLCLAFTSVACALGVALIGARSKAVVISVRNTSGITALKSSGYLRTIAGLIMLVGLISALLDYVFKVRASLSLEKGPALVGFFAAFYTATSVVAAVLQTLLARRALLRLGLARTLAILPATVLVTGVLGAAVPQLWSAAILRGTATVFESSLFRSGYEPLYTPLPADKKRSSKAIIDVALSRLGDALGGALILGLMLVLPGAPLTLVVLLAMACALLGLWLTRRLQRGYVAELATSLRSNAPSLLDLDPDEEPAPLAVSQTQMGMDRERLLTELARLRPAAITPLPAVATAERPAAAEPAPKLEPALLLEAAGQLLSGDSARAREALQRLPLDARLVPFVIPLLQQPELSLPATAALRSVAQEVVGELVDALSDRTRPVIVRRRLPRVLASSSHPRAVRGLVDALRDPELAVRKRAALALSGLVQQRPELKPPAALMFDAVRREVRAATTTLDLQHVFVILTLALDREAVELARRALRSDDDQQRGTALEYLETVLPEPLRSELWPHLRSSRRPRVAPQRSREEVLDELKRSTSGERRRRVRGRG